MPEAFGLRCLVQGDDFEHTEDCIPADATAKGYFGLRSTIGLHLISTELVQNGFTLDLLRVRCAGIVSLYLIHSRALVEREEEKGVASSIVVVTASEVWKQSPSGEQGNFSAKRSILFKKRI